LNDLVPGIFEIYETLEKSSHNPRLMQNQLYFSNIVLKEIKVSLKNIFFIDHLSLSEKLIRYNLNNFLSNQLISYSGPNLSDFWLTNGLIKKWCQICILILDLLLKTLGGFWCLVKRLATHIRKVVGSNPVADIQGRSKQFSVFYIQFTDQIFIVNPNFQCQLIKDGKQRSKVTPLRLLPQGVLRHQDLQRVQASCLLFKRMPRRRLVSVTIRARSQVVVQAQLRRRRSGLESFRRSGQGSWSDSATGLSRYTDQGLGIWTIHTDAD